VNLDELRHDLEREREHLLAGDAATAVAEIDRALEELAPKRLVTPTEAAAMLGVAEDLIVVLWCGSGFLVCQPAQDDPLGDPLIPVSEIERVMASVEVEEIRTLDRLHALTAPPGPDEGMSEEEKEILSATRPGRLPWQTDRTR